MYQRVQMMRSVRLEFARRYLCTFAENQSQLSEDDKLRGYVDKHIKIVNWNDAKPFHDIPGPKPIPIFGNILKFLPVTGDYYNMDLISWPKRLRKEYGDIVKMSDMKFRKDTVFLFNPDDIALAYRNEGPWPERPELRTLKYYKSVLRKNIFNDEGGLISGYVETTKVPYNTQGTDWYKSRSMANVPLMQPRSTNQYVEIIDEIAQEFIENVRKWAAKNIDCEMPENFLVEMNKFSMESVNLVGLNKRLGLLKENNPSGDSEKFIKCVGDFTRLTYELEFKLSFWKFMSTPKWREYIKTMDFILEFEMKYFKEAVSEVDWEGLYSRPDSELSILEKLLKKDKNRTFSVFFDLMFGTIDTSSRTIGAALYFLAVNPDVQEKLRKEVKRLLPSPELRITKDLINEMSYLRAVIKETQRFAPITVFGARVALDDIVLSGYQVPKGTEMLFSHLLLCRDDKFFHRAAEFIPERWLRGKNVEFVTENANPFVYMPFGFGVRMCIGRRLAQLQMETLIARLVKNFRISWPHPEMKWTVTVSHGVGSPLKFHMKPLQ